jgi:hypothetical protein
MARPRYAQEAAQPVVRWSAWARAQRPPVNRSWDRSGSSGEATHRRPHNAGVEPIEARPHSCEPAWFRMLNGPRRIRTRGTGDDGNDDVYAAYPPRD